MRYGTLGIGDTIARLINGLHDVTATTDQACECNERESLMLEQCNHKRKLRETQSLKCNAIRARNEEIGLHGSINVFRHQSKQKLAVIIPPEIKECSWFSAIFRTIEIARRPPCRHMQSAVASPSNL